MPTYYKYFLQKEFAFHEQFFLLLQIPLGDWIWPAIWMLPRQLAYGQWPASGEIDIMESRGNRDYTMNGVNIGVEQVT